MAAARSPILRAKRKRTIHIHAWQRTGGRRWCWRQRVERRKREKTRAALAVHLGFRWDEKMGKAKKVPERRAVGRNGREENCTFCISCCCTVYPTSNGNIILKTNIMRERCAAARGSVLIFLRFLSGRRLYRVRDTKLFIFNLHPRQAHECACWKTTFLCAE